MKVRNRSSMPQLLHNMSVPARTTIAHAAPKSRIVGRGIVFSIPVFACGSQRPLSIVELRRMMSLKFPRGADREQYLRDELDRLAQRLLLPACAMVSQQARDGDEVWQDLPSALAVIAKSSRMVYLRDKEPNLTALVAGMRVVLILPEETNDDR